MKFLITSNFGRRNDVWDLFDKVLESFKTKEYETILKDPVLDI